MAESRISPPEIRLLIAAGELPTVLDVRGSAAYKGSQERVEGDIRVMARDVADIAPDLDPTYWVLAYCTCLDDGLAVRAAERLHQLGIDRARAIVGGLDGCRRAGLDVVEKQ